MNMIEELIEKDAYSIIRDWLYESNPEESLIGEIDGDEYRFRIIESSTGDDGECHIYAIVTVDELPDKFWMINGISYSSWGEEEWDYTLNTAERETIIKIAYDVVPQSQLNSLLSEVEHGSDTIGNVFKSLFREIFEDFSEWIESCDINDPRSARDDLGDNREYTFRVIESTSRPQGGKLEIYAIYSVDQLPGRLWRSTGSNSGSGYVEWHTQLVLATPKAEVFNKYTIITNDDL